ncbi:hypothetical protein CsSME_00032236 [Camellia sinensis var. sinensis]
MSLSRQITQLQCFWTRETLFLKIMSRDLSHGKALTIPVTLFWLA